MGVWHLTTTLSTVVQPQQVPTAATWVQATAPNMVLSQPRRRGALSGKSPCAKKGKSSSAVRCCALQKNYKKIQPNKQSRGTHNTIEMPLSLSLSLSLYLLL